MGLVIIAESCFTNSTHSILYLPLDNSLLKCSVHVIDNMRNILKRTLTLLISRDRCEWNNRQLKAASKMAAKNLFFGDIKMPALGYGTWQVNNISVLLLDFNSLELNT